MPSTMVTVDGIPVQVSVTGPEKGPYVVVLGAAQHAPAAYDAVCQRLHTASVRTVVIGHDPRLHPKAVVGLLDALDVRWGVLVGDRAGAELAWELAATRLDRFTGLVVVDRGHPRVPDPQRRDPRPGLPAGRDQHHGSGQHPGGPRVAKASQRYVYSDYRLVEFAGRRNAAESTAQLAAEIVLRTSTW